jgi:hypothetical protein
MFSQMFYRVFMNGDQYVLIGVSGVSLVSPEQFGKEPRELPTACHEGFYATYELTPVGLYLIGLNRNEENGNYMRVGKVDPEKVVHQATCHEPSVLIPFTGKIRLAKDFINQPRVNVVYQKAIAFKTVFDITLKEGQVVGVKDRSWEMEQKRDALKECYRSPARLEKVLYAFSLDLDLE